MGPWTADDIAQARRVKFSLVLDYLGAYRETDPDYEPLDPDRRSVRVQVSYGGRDFRFIFTGEKFVDELLPVGLVGRGGGGAIDFVRYLTRQNFVHAVRVCLDARVPDARPSL